MTIIARIRQGVGLMMLIVSLSIVLPITAHAQYAEPDGTESNANLETKDASGNKVTCDSIALASGATAKGAVLGKVVPCLLYTIEQSTVTFTAKMVDWLSPLLFAFLTFVVVMFGVRVATNEPEVYKHGLILLIKIAIVGIILSDFGNYQAYDGSGSTGKLIPAVYEVMDESQSIVAGAINTTSMKCNVPDFEAGGAPKIWAVLDCVAGKIFGFKAAGGNGKGKMVLMTSLAGLLAGMFVSGPWGVAIVMGMLAVIMSMLSILVRTASAFINSYLLICLLIIISPLLMPLIFLRATAGYYDAVIRNILSSLLTPLLFTAFTLFTLMVYDQMLFANNSIVQDLMNYDKIKDALEPPTQACSLPVANNVTATRTGKPAPSDADISNVFNSQVSMFLENFMTPTLSGSNDACGALPKITPFNLSAVDDPKYQQGIKTDRELFYELLSLVIMGYLIISAMNALPDLIVRLASGGTATKATIYDGGPSIADRFMDASRKGMNTAFEKQKESNNNPPGQAGTGLGGAARAGVDKFLSTMKGKE